MSISRSRSTRPRPGCCRSRFPRPRSHLNNFLSRREHAGNLVVLVWLTMVPSAPQTRRLDESIGRARGRVAAMLHRDTTRETRAFLQVRRRPLRIMNSIWLRHRLSRTSCPPEPLLLSHVPTKARNEYNGHCHVDFLLPCRASPTPPPLSLHLHLRQKHWTLQSPRYATSNIDTMAEPTFLAASSILLPFSSQRYPSVLLHKDPFPTLLHHAFTIGLFYR